MKLRVEFPQSDCRSLRPFKIVDHFVPQPAWAAVSDFAAFYSTQEETVGIAQVGELGQQDRGRRGEVTRCG